MSVFEKDKGKVFFAYRSGFAFIPFVLCDPFSEFAFDGRQSKLLQMRIDIIDLECKEINEKGANVQNSKIVVVVANFKTEFLTAKEGKKSLDLKHSEGKKLRRRLNWHQSLFNVP